MRALHEGAEDGAVDSLWRRYWNNRGDWRDRNRVVEFYYPLVSEVVGRVTRQLPKIADRDLVQSAAALGLLAAVERFDPERGTRFPNFATTVMRNQIRRDLQRQRSMQTCFRSLDDERFKEMHCRLRRVCSVRKEIAIPPFLRQLEHTASADSADEGARVIREHPSSQPEKPEQSAPSSRRRQPKQPGFSSPQGWPEERKRPRRTARSGLSTPPEQTGRAAEPGHARQPGKPGRPGEVAPHRTTIVEAYYELEPRVRAMLYLHFAERVSQAKIAESFGISRPRVTQLLGDAIRRLTG